MRSISEDADVELDHKKCVIPKGTRISVIPARTNNDLYVIDESVEVTLSGEKYMLEDGDIVEMSSSGPYFVSNDINVNTDRGHCLFESGDRINIREGIFDYMDVPLYIKARRRINALLKRIMSLAHDSSEESIYNEIVNSKQFDRLKKLAEADTKDEVVSYIEMGVVEPAKDIESIADALEDAGEKRAASYVRRVAPRTSLGKISKWIKRVAGADDTEELEQLSQDKEAEDAEDKGSKVITITRDKLKELIKQAAQGSQATQSQATVQSPQTQSQTV